MNSTCTEFVLDVDIIYEFYIKVGTVYTRRQSNTMIVVIVMYLIL